MKVKALSRSKASTQRECVGDLRKHSRNLDPVYHPMQRPREMARAVQSAKMERMVSDDFPNSILLTRAHISSNILTWRVCWKSPVCKTSSRKFWQRSPRCRIPYRNFTKVVVANAFWVRGWDCFFMGSADTYVCFDPECPSTGRERTYFWTGSGLLLLLSGWNYSKIFYSWCTIEKERRRSIESEWRIRRHMEN